MYHSADRLWRLEQDSKRIRLWYGGAGKGWALQGEFRSVPALARWLLEHGDPVDEWVPD